MSEKEREGGKEGEGGKKEKGTHTQHTHTPVPRFVYKMLEIDMKEEIAGSPDLDGLISRKTGLYRIGWPLTFLSQAIPQKDVTTLWRHKQQQQQ